MNQPNKEKRREFVFFYLLSTYFSIFRCSRHIYPPNGRLSLSIAPIQLDKVSQLIFISLYHHNNCDIKKPRVFLVTISLSQWFIGRLFGRTIFYGYGLSLGVFNRPNMSRAGPK